MYRLNNNNADRNHLIYTNTYKSRLKLVSTLLATMSGIGVSQADELTEEDFLQGLPMVISATRLPQSVADTPSSITVIDRDLIAASGFVEIGDLFRLIPGFQVGLSWRDHHTATTYHGQTDGLSRRMQSHPAFAADATGAAGIAEVALRLGALLWFSVKRRV